MQEIHGPLEWVSVQDMARATEMCVKLVQLWSTSKSGKSAPASRKFGKRGPKADGKRVADWTG
jgi:tripeptide aminopeptidase